MSSLPLDFVEKFNENGIAVVENFLTSEQVDEMRRDMAEVVEAFDPNAHQRVVFDNKEQNHAKGRDNYFLNSADGIGYFLEKDAVDEAGNLKPVFEKGHAINKIGHGLHLHRPIFKKNTFTAETKEIARALGFRRPVVIQSMYIFKQPRIGDAAKPHQDATFLYLDPPSSLLGIWVALHDATLENGCLWYAPGSHKLGLIDNSRMIREIDPVTNDVNLKFTGPWPMPNEERFNFVPIQVKAGSAVAIHGLVIHKSEHNYSDKPRNCYTFHIAESDGVQWDTKNWLQPLNGPFVPLY